MQDQLNANVVHFFGILYFIQGRHLHSFVPVDEQVSEVEPIAIVLFRTIETGSDSKELGGPVVEFLSHL